MVKWGVGLLALGIAWSTACGKDKGGEPAKKPPSEPAVVEPQKTPDKPVTPPEPPPPAAGKSGHKDMANCPSAVAGAVTKVSDVADGVEVMVTAGDAAAVAEIRARAGKLVASAKAAGEAIEHTGQGTGGGAIGKCPVVLRDTSLTTTEIEGGVSVTVKPNHPEELAALRAAARNRSAALAAGAEPGGGKAGQGQMANCPSAVAGAKTAVADLADGVEVTVTAADAAAVTEIRARTGKLVESAKAGAGALDHTSHGTGGGAIGKCPVVLSGTTLASAEVEGGVKITVKPEKGEELRALQQAARDRSAALAAEPAN